MNAKNNDNSNENLNSLKEILNSFPKLQGNNNDFRC